MSSELLTNVLEPSLLLWSVKVLDGRTGQSTQIAVFRDKGLADEYTNDLLDRNLAIVDIFVSPLITYDKAYLERKKRAQ